MIGRLLTTFILSVILVNLLAQRPQNMYASNEGITTVTGTVLDQESKIPIEFATVIIGDLKNDKPLKGATTSLDGRFKLSTNLHEFYIEISFIGFIKKRIGDFKIIKGQVSLGEILLSPDNKLLDEVVVRGDKSITEFRLDKRVFNVGKDLSSTGASALEVLNNVPSVNVNIEGQISLRGNTGVQILINGKPSVMATDESNALGTITAEMIERVEVITNPSAKYDAEGTAGIINIVIKKDERKGINGSVSFNTGVPDNHSLGLSLNRRTEKFNFFSQLGVGYRELPNKTRNINRDLLSGVTIFSDGEGFRNEIFYNIILGADYHVNKLNVITLSGNYALEDEKQPSQTYFSKSDASGLVASEWRRKESTDAINPKYSFELQYKKDFSDDEDHNFIFSALGNFFGKKQNSSFENIMVFGDGNQDLKQKTETDFQEGKFTFKADYTKPIKEIWVFETGVQYVINDVSNDFEVTDLVGDEWVVDTDQTNLFEFNQDVLGVYGTIGYEQNQWGVKIGSRIENTMLTTVLKTTNEKNEQNYTNLFPSFHASYKISRGLSIQAGYSKRIYRPRLWDLNPFFNIRNNFNIRTGNPNLRPEYTDSYEVGLISDWEDISINTSFYVLNTVDVIERISTFEDNVTNTLPMNIGLRRSMGLEVNAKYEPLKWLTLNGDLNYNHFTREGTYEAIAFDFNADKWSAKLNSKWVFLGILDFEITGRYISRYQTLQSIVSDNLFFDVGIRKKILKGRGVFNLSVRDVFADRIREQTNSQESFFFYSFSQRGRFLAFGFSYGFGKGEAMQYLGQRRR